MATQKQTQAKHDAKKRSRGLTRVTVWVPVEKRVGFIAAAKKMCVINS
jgi:hypothetical protein